MVLFLIQQSLFRFFTFKVTIEKFPNIILEHQSLCVLALSKHLYAFKSRYFYTNFPTVTCISSIWCNDLYCMIAYLMSCWDLFKSCRFICEKNGHTTNPISHTKYENVASIPSVEVMAYQLTHRWHSDIQTAFMNYGIWNQPNCHTFKKSITLPN